MKIKQLLFLSAISTMVLLSSCGQKMTGNVKLATDNDTLSYVLGADIGKNLNNMSVEEVNYNALLNGLVDAFEEKDLQVDEEKIKPYIQQFFKDLQKKKISKNAEEGAIFLEENKKREGVITTESGLQYEIITEGTGKSPSATDVVKCHYHGTTLDGKSFDSTVDKEPREFALNQVLSGWTEGVQLMKEGAKYKFYIPSDLAYGVRGSRGIEPNLTLIFEIELLEVKPPKQETK